MRELVDLLDEARTCRDQAERTRRLLGSFSHEGDQARLSSYAEELDLRATELEKEAGF
jgi:hypothetical protein